MAEAKNTQQGYADQLAQKIIEQLRQGTAPWLKPWSPADGQDLPYNHTTGNRYSGTNSLMLSVQMREDPRWMTYKQAKSIDCQVRKGEKGVGLIKLITHREITKTDAQGKPLKDDQGKPIKVFSLLERPFIKGFTVFNGEQIDGLPRWERTPLTMDWVPDDPAETLLKASGADIKHEAGDRAYYSLTKDHIVLPEQKQFQNASLYYATALHELGHWTGHPDRLDRDMSGGFGSDNYAKEELRAEIASMMLNRELGLEHDPGQHLAYVQSWIKALENDPMEIIHATRDAQKIQNYVLGLEQAQAPVPQPTVEEARLAAAKASYLEQSVFLSAAEQRNRRVLEYNVGRLIQSLPEDHKVTAWTNFYESEVAKHQPVLGQLKGNDNLIGGQDDLFIER
ncbi:MAG: DUF1738 domain-containing protein [Neisseriaceae bacterium]|nr:DUF1738 domain-containing protein [Neisseriaceae bacterium]